MLEKVAINDRILLSYLYFHGIRLRILVCADDEQDSDQRRLFGWGESPTTKSRWQTSTTSRGRLSRHTKSTKRCCKSTKPRERPQVDELHREIKTRREGQGPRRHGRPQHAGSHSYTFMDNVAKSMAFLIADMKNAKQVVGNMEEPDEIRFADFEKTKRLNGKPIKQCIMDAYCFAVAFKERLANGDLFPLTPMTDEEMISNRLVQLRQFDTCACLNRQNSEHARAWRYSRAFCFDAISR
jgi:hypothetical protein